MRDTARRDLFGVDANKMSTATLSVRVNRGNLTHHLWNNHGTWWLHYTLHLPDHATRRIRKNLRTRHLGRARLLRDELLAALEARHCPHKIYLLKNKKVKAYEPLLPNGIEITKKAKKTK